MSSALQSSINNKRVHASRTVPAPTANPSITTTTGPSSEESDKTEKTVVLAMDSQDVQANSPPLIQRKRMADEEPGSDHDIIVNHPPQPKHLKPDNEIAKSFVLLKDLLLAEFDKVDFSGAFVKIGHGEWPTDVFSRHCVIGVKSTRTGVIRKYIDKRSPKCLAVILALQNADRCVRYPPVVNTLEYEDVKQYFHGNVNQYIATMKGRREILFNFLYYGYLINNIDNNKVLLPGRCNCNEAYNCNRRIVIIKNGKSRNSVSSKCARKDDSMSCGVSWKTLLIGKSSLIQCSDIFRLTYEDRRPEDYDIMEEDDKEPRVSSTSCNIYNDRYEESLHEIIPGTQPMPDPNLDKE